MMTARSLTRRTGTAVATLAAAGIAVLSLAGTAAAAAPDAPAAVQQAQDVDCADLSRAEAQALLNADPSDPHRLDRDDDGLACEDGDAVSSPATGPDDAPTPTDEPDQASSTDEPDRVSPAGEPGQVSAVPAGGVEAGDGSAGTGGTEPTAFLLAGSGAVLAAGAGAAVWGGRRSGRAPRRPGHGTGHGRA